MPESITHPQGLWLDLIRLSSFNEFDGVKVVGDLVAHQDLWEAAIMLQDTRAGVTMRDMPLGYHNVDTLLILVPKGKEKSMAALTKGWEVDTLRWVKNPARFLGGGEGSVLSLWWD